MQPIKFSSIDGPEGQAFISAAERHGRDGRGKGGLHGYMIFLCKEHPAKFVTLLNKVLRAELATPPTRVRRRSARFQDDSFIAIGEAVKHAANVLGRDGKGRDGMTGYFRSLARRNAALFVRLLITILAAEAAEHNLKANRRPM